MVDGFEFQLRDLYGYRRYLIPKMKEAKRPTHDLGAKYSSVIVILTILLSIQCEISQREQVFILHCGIMSCLHSPTHTYPIHDIYHKQIPALQVQFSANINSTIHLIQCDNIIHPSILQKSSKASYYLFRATPKLPFQIDKYFPYWFPLISQIYHGISSSRVYYHLGETVGRNFL